jgi:two-component system, sensor histidine kinase and response regulator
MRYAILSLVMAFLCLMQIAAFSKPTSHYIKQLQESSTRENFNQVFGAMIVDFKTGKLSFTDRDVMSIVNIAKNKSFATLLLPQVYGWAGTMFGNGRMGEALKYFMESARLYERQNKTLPQALCYFEMGLIQHKAENYEEAETYYNKTLLLANDSLDHRTRINCYNGLGMIRRVRKQYYNAFGEFRVAYQIAKKNNDVVWMGILSGNIGSIHMLKSDYDSSLYYYFQDLNVVRNTLEFENEIETYSNIANVFLMKKDFANTKAYLDSAVNIITGRKIKFNDFFNPMDEIHKTYAALSAATGDYKKAFFHFEKYHEVAKAKQQNVNGRSLRNLQSAFTFEQKQSELELLQKINAAHLLVIDQQRFIGIASGFIILLMSLVAYIAFRTSSQRKKLNRKLATSNAELERLNSVKDKLFSVLSHDLRSPIASLKSLLNLFNNAFLTPKESSEVLRKLNHQLEVSENVLESLLQWAKAELNEKTDNEKIILADVVNNVALQLSSMMDEKKITFCSNVNFQLIALADKTQVEIILRNLIANAVKFTPVGGAINIQGRAGENSIIVTVEDNGMGMHEEQVENLFKPGKHISTSGTNDEKGTGLGLIITKEMIAKNGGSIWVNSSKHKGTVFTFSLPIAS